MNVPFTSKNIRMGDMLSEVKMESFLQNRLAISEESSIYFSFLI